MYWEGFMQSIYFLFKSTSDKFDIQSGMINREQLPLLLHVYQNVGNLLIPLDRSWFFFIQPLNCEAEKRFIINHFQHFRMIDIINHSDN